MFMLLSEQAARNPHGPYELNGSNGSASFLVYTRKNIFVGGCGFFVSDVMSEVVLGSVWLMFPGLGPNR